ncbi:MAG TPA: DUF3500 domain-containing protein [Chthonomonadaceae bacterium]|nr:DUF3500 domain-containing protein [Chthonomonadaceae bacterium]
MADNNALPQETCPECEGLSRREFLQTVGKAVGGVALAGAAAWTLPAAAQSVARPHAAPVGKPAKAETLVKTLYDSLTPRQREIVCMPWTHPKRSMVQANWAIVEPTLGDLFNRDQQEMIRGILRGITTDAWYPKILKQMQNDSGGLETYHVALFGDPDGGKFEWVLTGRHVTLRADGHSNANAAFGGPIFYGHAPKFNEDPDHPGNIYWHQAQKANAVFAALDGKQRAIALLDQPPSEAKIQLQGAHGEFPGIAIGELSRDQKQLVQGVMRDLLAPYRPSDADEVMRDIAANGGLDQIHLSFYKQEDLGNDGIWDIWRLEGPALVWHFRGAPHIHTWVNVVKNSAVADAHT